MARTKSYIPYRLKTEPSRKNEIDRILKQLEKSGVSVGRYGKTSVILSRHLKDYVTQGKIYFTWNKKSQSSVITIHPAFKLTITKTGKVKIIQK